MDSLSRHTTDQVRHRIETTDRLLRAVVHLTPRQATLFLLSFDLCFARVTGHEATETQRLLVTAALRRAATTDS
ncbi:MAG: hypothetical protein HYY04_17870 [Chloroflexi bacterium]|nr:hypothetical protein [Chloroflexota bacterium]